MRIDAPQFSILAIAPFSPALGTVTPPVVTTDAQSLDQAMAEIRPVLDIPVDKALSPTGTVTVTIASLGDLRPKRLAANTPLLKQLAEARQHVASGGNPSDLAAKFPDAAQLVTIPSPTARSGAGAKASAIDDILSMVDTGSGGGSSPAPGGSVESQIDELVGRILTAIYADPNFRRMEAAWRGAELVARQAPSSSDHSIGLTLVPMPAGDLAPVLDRLEQTLAATPPDLIIVDEAIANTPRHMALLERLMDCAETLLAPLAVPLGANFFGIADWSEIKSLRFIPGLLEGAEYGRWKTLVTRSGAGWMIPCVGNPMARDSHESVRGLTEAAPLWTSSAWGVGALCARSFAVHGRPTRLTDRGTVSLDGMPLTDGHPPVPLEAVFDTERRADFKQAGIMPLACTPGRDHIFATSAVTMDGGPLNFRLFLSQLTGFLIRMATTRRDEISNIETDLPEAVSLFIQALGLPVPDDLKITASDEKDGMTPLEISLTPDPEILPGGQRFTFGFGW